MKEEKDDLFLNGTILTLPAKILRRTEFTLSHKTTKTIVKIYEKLVFKESCNEKQ